MNETGLASEQVTPDPAQRIEDGSHLGEFRAVELDPGDGFAAVIGADELEEQQAEEAEAQMRAELLGQDAFFEVFQIAFNMPGLFVSTFKPLGIQDGEEAQARAASDATHRLLEIYCPSVLRPGGETLALLLAAGPFFIAKAMVFRDILAAAKAKPVRQDKPDAGQPEAANDDYAPPPGAQSPTSWMDAEGKVA